MTVKLYRKSKRNKFIHNCKFIHRKPPKNSPYLGRFAPSPTGPLHYGSLVAAVASYLQARSNYGQWNIRIEDIDPARQARGSIQSILDTLNYFGFVSENPPILQSSKVNYHKHIATRLYELGLAYSCICSRKDYSTTSEIGKMGLIYPGTCSAKQYPFSGNTNLRLRTQYEVIRFNDKHFGDQECEINSESGDYVIYRAEGLPSYILAASVDDVCEHYTEIVRGADLIDITPRQIHLSNIIFGVTQNFMHIPVITNQNGEKLSKQTHAPALSKLHARSWLYYALTDLGQEPPKNLLWRPIWCTWDWAFTHWQIENIPKQSSIVFDH